MKKSELKQIIKEEISNVLNENLDGSPHHTTHIHLEQIERDLMYGGFETPEDEDEFLDGIIAGIEEPRTKYRENRAI